MDLTLKIKNSFETHCLFFTTASWWVLPRFWMTASPHKSTGVFSVLCPILMLLFGWSPLVRLFPRHYYYHYFTPWRFLHTSVTWWSSTGVWMTTRLLKSLGLFSVFWLISPRHFIFKSSNDFINPLVNQQSAQTTIVITVTFMFHSFSVL